MKLKQCRNAFAEFSRAARKLGLCLVCITGITHLSVAQETVVYSQGFESDNGGYVLDFGNNAEWEWGTPSGTGPGGAHSGTKCWGTDLDNTLNRPCEGSIVSPAINLPTISGNQLIRLRFWAYVAIDGMYDRCQFFVSKDRVNWESLIQLYHNMETNPSLPSSWKKYEFTLDPSYAGRPVYLRFRAAVLYESPTFYCSGSGNLTGFYVDDIAITVFDTTGNRKLFSMEAWEDQSAWASCPWVAPWNGSEFALDNDIYPVARMPQNEMTDFYKLQKPLVERAGTYPIEVREIESEVSFTDYAALVQVDHAPDVAVAPDEEGNLLTYRPAGLRVPEAAINDAGQDVLGLISQEDSVGYAAYSEDAILLDFGTPNLEGGAVLVLRVKGFVLGAGAEKPYIGPPAIVVETLDPRGWQERGRFFPRYESAIAAFDLGPYLAPNSVVLVRLRSVSHSVKYHSIDFAALALGPRPPVAAALVLPSNATFSGLNVLPTLAEVDGASVEMTSGGKFLLEFPALPLAKGLTRDFIFVSRGYYIPKGGSYLIYTWDGANWVLRDSYSYPASDFTKSFDLSLFLPDPKGEYRVRVWQDYQWEPAGIDFVTMKEGSFTAPLNFAWDYRAGASIYNTVFASDNNKTYWTGCPRNRVTEYNFTPPIAPNIPPTTCPVSVSAADPPVISWVYADTESSPQAQAEVEVWTGAGGTGSIVWDPSVLSGTATSITYGGPLLTPGTYYARVRANDGKDWGQWCEQEFGRKIEICGDLDKDGDVDSADYVLFRGHYGKRVGQPGFIAEADYDKDGIGCLHDYSAWYKCYQNYLKTKP